MTLQVCRLQVFGNFCKFLQTSENFCHGFCGILISFHGSLCYWPVRENAVAPLQYVDPQAEFFKNYGWLKKNWLIVGLAELSQ